MPISRRRRFTPEWLFESCEEIHELTRPRAKLERLKKEDNEDEEAPPTPEELLSFFASVLGDVEAGILNVIARQLADRAIPEELGCSGEVPARLPICALFLLLLRLPLIRFDPRLEGRHPSALVVGLRESTVLFQLIILPAHAIIEKEVTPCLD